MSSRMKILWNHLPFFLFSTFCQIWQYFLNKKLPLKLRSHQSQSLHISKSLRTKPERESKRNLYKDELSDETTLRSSSFFVFSAFCQMWPSIHCFIDSGTNMRSFLWRQLIFLVLVCRVNGDQTIKVGESQSEPLFSS